MNLGQGRWSGKNTERSHLECGHPITIVISSIHLPERLVAEPERNRAELEENKEAGRFIRSLAKSEW